MGNHYLEKQEAVRRANVIVAQDQMQQYDVDIWSVLLHNKKGFGKKVLRELITDFVALHEKYLIAFDPTHPEADYYRELLDRELREIWGDEMEEFEQRHPFAKKIRYDKPAKHQHKKRRR